MEKSPQLNDLNNHPGAIAGSNSRYLIATVPFCLHFMKLKKGKPWQLALLFCGEILSKKTC